MSATKRFRFSSRFRLRRRDEFRRVMEHGQHVGDQRLQIWVLPNDLDHSRLGLIVGRQHGNAVHRHRIKRVLREAFRLSRERLPSGLDLACAPRVGTKVELQDTLDSLAKLTKRLARKLASERPRIQT
jgi:ribonuclease P protein component